jgi:hypothetical protein
MMIFKNFVFSDFYPFNAIIDNLNKI